VPNRPSNRTAPPPCSSNWEGIYILYTYAARRSTARAVQQLLSNPEAGSEDVVLRFVTFCKH
jgi:small subunit ribosomal protein S6